jgi:hypothetical protein
MPKTSRQVLDEQKLQAERDLIKRSKTMTAAESYDEWFPSNFLKADDLDEGSMTLTITDIRPEKMQDGNSKPCVFFKEDKRALVLNVTNKNSLVLLSKSKNPRDAIGMRVTLVQVEAEYQGKPCKALRIRKPPALGRAPAKKTLAEEMDDSI